MTNKKETLSRKNLNLSLPNSTKAKKAYGEKEMKNTG
jgi:hypothetical protein